MDLQRLIAAHMPISAVLLQDTCSEPSELTRERIDNALDKTRARISEMSGARVPPVRTSFVSVVCDADAAGLTMEAFGQIFDQALRETL